MLRTFFIILLIFTLNTANADESLLTLKQQLERLQREVSDLSKSVYTGKKIDNTNDASQQIKQADLLQFTAFDLRIYDLEKDLKKLNENFEELIFKIDDLNDLYKQLSLNLQTLILSETDETIKDKNDNTVIEIQDTDKESLNNNKLGTIVINSEDLSNQNNIDTEPSKELKEKLTKISPEDEFQLAFDLLRSQKFTKAKDHLKTFIENNSDNELSGSAHYWLGEIYLLKKEYRDAALTFAEGYQKFPKSIKAPEMLFKLSDSLVNIDKVDDACNTLFKLTKEFPKNNFTIKSKDRVKELNCISSTE
jgi:tol-pal system protein YbgF